MPARDINFGDVTVHVRGHYISEHSDAEYETLRKAFLLLGERYDELEEDYNDLVEQYNQELDMEIERLYGDEW